MVPERSSERRTDASIHSVDRRRFLAGAAGATAVATAGCLDVLGQDGDGSSGATPGWKTYRGDRRRTGKAPADAGPGESFSVAWETSALDLAEHQHDVTAVSELEADDDTDAYVGYGICSPATLTDDLVLCTMYYIVGAEEDDLSWGGVVALDPATGSFEWSIQGMPPTVTPPTVIDGQLSMLVGFPIDSGPQEAHLLVADAENGAVQRRQTLTGLGDDESITRKAVTITSDTAYFPPWSDADWDGLALETETGDQGWTTNAASPTYTDYAFTPVDDLVLYTGGGGENPMEVIALDAASGEEQWRSSPEFPMNPSGYHEWLGTPTVVGDRGYVTGAWEAFNDSETRGSGLHSFDASTGEERWQFRPEGVPLESLTGTVDRAICEAGDNCATGSYAGLHGIPLVLDGTVVVAGFGQPAEGGQSHEDHRHLYAIDDDDGSLRWSMPGLAAAPVAAGDVLYVRLVGDSIVALSTDGSVLGSVESGARASTAHSPSIGHGRLYTQWDRSTVGSTSPTDTMVAIE